MKIIWEEKVHEWKFLDYINIYIELPNKKQKIWEKVSRKWPWAVWALVEHTDNNSFILVEQFRPAVNARVLELVAWVIDKPWKSNKQIMIEEIREEIWYTTNQIEFIMSWPKSAGMTDEMSYDYYAQVSWNRKEQILSESEDIEIIEVEKQKINTLLEQKEKNWILVSPWICAILYKLLTLWKIELK